MTENEKIENFKKSFKVGKKFLAKKKLEGEKYLMSFVLGVKEYLDSNFAETVGYQYKRVR